jgi:hypothetical protein
MCDLHAPTNKGNRECKLLIAAVCNDYYISKADDQWMCVPRRGICISSAFSKFLMQKLTLSVLYMESLKNNLQFVWMFIVKPTRDPIYCSLLNLLYSEIRNMPTIWWFVVWNFNMHLYPSSVLEMSALECLEFVVWVPKPQIWRQLVGLRKEHCLHVNLCSVIVLAEKTAYNSRGRVCTCRIILLSAILIGIKH